MVSKKKILKTTLMPEYLPRLKNLFGASFHYTAYLIAIVFNIVRLLPNNHAYLTAEKFGKFSVLNVISVAANNISFKKENIDQIIIFFSILCALLILVMQFFLLFFVFAIPKSFAQNIPNNIQEFFITANADSDLAFAILNMVFGHPTFFTPNGHNYGLPLHDGLFALFNFYSYGMLIVGTIIIIYFAITTVMETAQSGTPFGRRFNKTWVPVRLILFFALLIPTVNGFGYNPAQYITLMSAKLGSGFATNGWNIYNQQIASTGTGETLVGTEEANFGIPTRSDMLSIPAFMTVVRTCTLAYRAIYNTYDFPAPSWIPGVEPWAVYKDASGLTQSELMTGATYEGLLQSSNGTDISIVFGFRDPELYHEMAGNVEPICGSIELRATDVSQPGPAIIRQAYYQLIIDIWQNNVSVSQLDTNGNINVAAINIDEYAQYWVKESLASIPITDEGAGAPPTRAWQNMWEDYMNELMGNGTTSGVIYDARQAQISGSNWQVPQELEQFGWAGAGIWYNTVAEQNGAFVAAVRNLPTPALYPRIMQEIENSKRREDTNPEAETRFNDDLASGNAPTMMKASEKEVARAMVKPYQYWLDNPEASQTGNAFVDIINVILGTQGLFEICKNVNIHPLAQLSTVGKSMLDSSIRSFGMSAGFNLFSIVPNFGSTGAAVAEMFGTIAGVGLLVGFILFYILPFMPFIYFFFSVAGWVKTIFEAMVAMPLWALAHLRIDGEGIFGDAAIKGYFLIFEIFIRPILIVFGLIASIVIFATMVKVLNQIFYLLLANTAGLSSQSGNQCFTDMGVLTPSRRVAQEVEATSGGPLDEFFFTVLYAIIVYIIGTSCFKLIDQIPNQIVRWFNGDVSTFSDNAGDSAEGLMKYATMGGSQFGSQLGSSVGGLGKGLKDQVKTIGTSFAE